MNNINDLIQDLNKHAAKEVDDIVTDILNHFSYTTGIDLDDYVYKDNETEPTETETPAGGEADGQI